MRRLVEGYCEMRDLGPSEVKGVAGKIKVFEVMANGASRGHFDVAAKAAFSMSANRAIKESLLRVALLSRSDDGSFPRISEHLELMLSKRPVERGVNKYGYPE